MRIGDWKALTCPLDIRNLIQLGDTTYCATGGGLLLYHNSTFEVLTTVNGLYGIDLLSISKDSYNNIWIEFLRLKNYSEFLSYYILAIKIDALMRLLTLTLILPLSGCDIPFVPFF